MKIYLLSTDSQRFFFYADDSNATQETVSDPASSEKNDRTPFLARWRKRLIEQGRDMRASWERSDSRAARWTRRAWDWLHSWSHPDHATLARLRSARRIEIYFPASRPLKQVEGLWDGYLARRWRRHILWAIVNSVIAPVTALLAILPGPNLIGYWFAYRAVHHALILRGLWRARRRLVPTTFHPLGSLDRPIDRTGAVKDEPADADTNARSNPNVKTKVKASHAALEGEAAKLEEHAARAESSGCFLAPSSPETPGDSATSQP